MTTTKAEQPTITQAEKDAAALKPCPWCGATCIVVTADNQDFAAACGFCRCFGPRNVSRTEAIAAWNTRTPSLAAQDGLVEALKIAFWASIQNANGDHKYLDYDSLDEIITAAWTGFEDAALSAIKGDKS